MFTKILAAVQLVGRFYGDASTLVKKGWGAASIFFRRRQKDKIDAASEGAKEGSLESLKDLEDIINKRR